MSKKISFKNRLEEKCQMLNDNHLEWSEDILQFSTRISLNRTNRES
jgi:hypothetical protein